MLRATVVSSLSPVACPFHRIKEPCRTAVILDAVSGLCVGELLGLKWLDVNFEQFELNVTRSVSRQVVTPCKTEVSRKPIPMNPEIAEMFSDGGWKLHKGAGPFDFRQPAQSGNPTVLAWIAVQGAC
jgi:integrase